jgi:DNA-binding response OmpR family regulator
MRTDEGSSWLEAVGKQDPWPVVAIYDRDMTLGGLAAALKAHGSEVLHLADAHWFAGLAKDNAIGLAIIHCGAQDAAALRLCDEIRASPRGFFLPILLLVPEEDEILLNFARSSAADIVIPSSEGIDYAALRAMDLLQKPRHRGPWTMFGWMAVNARDKKAASSGRPITMQPVPFELYRMILEHPLQTHSLRGFASGLREAGIARSQPSNMSKVLTAIRHAFETRDELFPLRTIYGEGYRLELGIRNNPERYQGKLRARLFVGGSNPA